MECRQWDGDGDAPSRVQSREPILRICAMRYLDSTSEVDCDPWLAIRRPDIQRSLGSRDTFGIQVFEPYFG